MRILHLTDTHLGIEMPAWGHPRGWRRADDHEAAARRALAPALRGEVDLVVHSGDVFDRSRPPATAIGATIALLAEAARVVPVVVMPGNHDRHGLLGSLSTPVPGLHVVDGPERLVFGDVALAFVPYRREAEQWATSAAEAVGPGVDALVAHQSFHGAKVPNYTFRKGHLGETVGASDLPRGVPWILCGHIHPRQVVRLGQATIVHPGSTTRTAFSEGPEPKGYAIWSFDRQVSWRFVPLPERPMIRVGCEADLRGVVPEALVRLERGAPIGLAAEVIARGAWFANVKPPPGFRRAASEAQPALFKIPA